MVLVAKKLHTKLYLEVQTMVLLIIQMKYIKQLRSQLLTICTGRILHTHCCLDRNPSSAYLQELCTNLFNDILDLKPLAAYEAVCLYKGSRMIMSSGETVIIWKVHQLILYCCCGILAGIVGGLLGLGGGFILCPLFLELRIPPQVSSATAAFVMIFSSSMSVIQYYLLRRFPVPYALYFIAVASIAALVGQHVVRRIISIVGRASVIIFILAFTIFVSAISLGGVGIADTIKKIEEGQHMGFDNLCAYN